MYQPEEDSYLLSEALVSYLSELKNKNAKFLDLGTGSGIQSETASRFLEKNNILAVDTDPEALNYVKNLGFKVLTSNLLSQVRGKYDIIAFNPPYLPKDKYDNKKDTSGGKKGDEIILRFLKQAKKHLTDSGVIFLLLSSLTPKKRILEELDKQHFKAESVLSKNLFFEQLEVWLISASS